MTASPICLLQGDAHLSEYIWGKRPQIRGDAYHAFEQVVGHAVRLNVPLILAGDVFDTTNPTTADVHFFRIQMDHLRQAGVPVYHFQGNHDRRNLPWSDAIHSHPVYVGDGRPFSLDGVSFRAFDYDSHDRIQTRVEMLASEPLPDVLLLHQAAKQALKFDGAWNFDLQTVPQGIHTVILGDIHTPFAQRFREGCTAYYTSATHPRSDAEFGQKDTLVLYDDFHVERLPIVNRFFAKVVLAVEPEKTADALVQQLSQQPAGPLTPCVVTTTLNNEAALAARAKIALALEAVGGHLFDTVVANEAECEWAEGVGNDLPPADELLAKMVNKADEPEVFSLVLDIIQSRESPLEIVARTRDHFQSKKDS